MRATTNGRYFLLLSASIVDSLILINNLSTERAQFMKVVLIRLNALFSSLHAVFFKIIFVYIGSQVPPVTVELTPENEKLSAQVTKQ